VLPFFGESDTIPSGNRVGRDLGDVEACGTDDDVEFMEDAVCCADACALDAGYLGVCQSDVGLGESFEVAVARCYSATLCLACSPLSWG
jgi:hypothetical protein